MAIFPGRSRRVGSSLASSLTEPDTSHPTPGTERPLSSAAVDFDLPQDLSDYLAELDEFIEREIKPLL